MSTYGQSRRAHELVDAIRDGYTPDRVDIDFLRSFLPEPPKQKALEEIVEHVRNAWVGASGNEWAGNSYDPEIPVESWLRELYTQLAGLAPAKPAAVPALPAGMRLADHEHYGRVVVSPGLNDFGLYLIFVLDSDYKEGAHWHCEHGRTLTFIDAKPAHPEFLETEAEYENAPEGTIVAKDSSGSVCVKTCLWPDMMVPTVKRRVLRWGWGDK